MAMKIKRAASEKGPASPVPARGGLSITPLLHPAPPAKATTSSGSFVRPSMLLPPASPATSGTGPHGRTEVRNDILETTKHQLQQALEIDPANAKAHAMLLVTHYRLGRMDDLMKTLRQARNRGIPPAALKAVTRCDQLVKEEMVLCRLPLDLHGEFMEYLGL